MLVLAPHEADLRHRAALDRALRLQPARIVRVFLDERWPTARRLAAEGVAEWIVFIDEDVLPAADAFGALHRACASGPAIVGGRALVAGEQRFGDMFAPPRWGPDAIELNGINAPESMRNVADAMRGPMDVAARGLLVVAASFVRACPDEPLDPWALHLELALRARRGGSTTLCEPRLTFSARPDPPELVRRLPRLLRAIDDAWTQGELHRDPAGARERLIGREQRTAGNIRGYERRPYPPLSLLIAGASPAPRSVAALRLATGASEVATCKPDDAGELRRRLQLSADRYLLVIDEQRALSRADFVSLVERVERSGRHALALQTESPPYGAALFHLGRVSGAREFAGESVAAVIAAAMRRLPERRFFAVGPAGVLMPERLPAIAAPNSLTFVFLATCRPGVTRQAFGALSQAIGTHPIVAVIPAGAATTRKVLSAWPETTIVEDDVDPNLGAGLNRTLAKLETDLVLVVRDDVQVPPVSVHNMAAAFGRIPGLGAVGPRINGAAPPQGIAEGQYRDLPDMETFTERRARDYAREANLVPGLFAPALMISRAGLEAVGGFDPTLGFTHFGIFDYTRRLTSANLAVAYSNDTFVHIFPTEASESLLAASDVSPVLAAIFERRWKERSTFDAARDVVAFGASTESAPASSGDAPEVTVVVPVGDAAEWEVLRPALGALVVSLTIEDPVEIAIGLDGSFDVQHAVRAMRELLADAAVPLERTVNVRIESISSSHTWHYTPERAVRLSETTREAFAALRAIEGVNELRAVLGR